MKKIIPLIIFLIIGIFLFLSLNSNPNKLPSPLVGKNVPEINGKDFFTNENVKLIDLMDNQMVLVNVWASWCSPCRAEEPTLSALSQKYSDVQFIGILTRDNPVNAEAFNRKRGTPYPTLIDDSILSGFRKSLPANAIPTTVVIDREGKVASRISGVVTVASLSQLIEEALAE